MPSRHILWRRALGSSRSSKGGVRYCERPEPFLPSISDTECSIKPFRQTNNMLEYVRAGGHAENLQVEKLTASPLPGA